MNSIVDRSMFSGLQIWAFAISTACNLIPFLDAQVGVTVTPGGVVSSASYTAQISAGSLFTVFGSGFSTGVTTSVNFPLPTSMSGTSVTVNGALCPLLYVSPTQINAQVPLGVQLGVDTVVVTLNQSSASTTVRVVEASPGIFVSADGFAIAQRTNGSLVSEVWAVSPGDNLTIYGTGIGTVNPPVTSGQPAGSGPSLSSSALMYSATIGGINAPISFVGLTPGLAGLMQINLQVPSGITVPPGGGAVQFLLTINGVTSQASVFVPIADISASTFASQCDPCGTITVPTSVLKGQILGPANGYLGTGSTCVLRAGSKLMTFNATPSGNWLSVIPTFGTLLANQTTPIAISQLDGRSIPYSTRGLVTISAAGYPDNNGMGVIVNQAGIQNGQAVDQVKFSCTVPVAEPLAGSPQSSFARQCSPCSTVTIPTTLLKTQVITPTLGYLGDSTSCVLKAGSTAMKFTAQPSGNWFNVTPSYGTLLPNETTPIELSEFDGRTIPSGSTGLVTISAPGYPDNNGMGLSFQMAGIQNGQAVDSIKLSCQ
jgi:uncharacterized protein (TIGR03437 family)